MIEINKNKLIPAVTANWGEIVGDIDSQKDLVEYIDEHGGGVAAWGSISGNISDQSDLMSTLGSYATESWVSSQQFATESWVSEQGYLTSVPSEYATQSWVSEQGYLTSSALTGYATESWVSEQGYLTSTALSGYATESWVSGQGYITSSALTGYATQSWVSEQGYLTSTSLKTVNNQSLVGEGNIEIGGLTPQQEAAIAPLENTSEGILYTDVIEGNKENVKRSPTTSTLDGDYIYTTIGGIYLLQDLDLYKLNSDTLVFDYVTHSTQGNFQPLWMDNSGRLYQGSYLETNLTTGATTEVDLNIDEFRYDRNRCNIYNGSVGIWNVSSGGLRLFNEQQKKFIDDGYTLTLPEDYTGNISYDIRYVFTYKGHKLFHTFENKTYEVVDTNTGLTVTDVTGTYYPIPEFTINPYFIFPTEDGNLRYAHQNDSYFYTGSGSWQSGTTHITGWFGVGYAVSGNCVIGGISRSDSYYSVINFGPELKPTYWSPVKDVAVDLDSYQRIQATKIFDSIQVSNIQINYISPYGGNTTNFDLGQNNTNASKMEFTVPGMFTLNGTNIATTDKCFVNRSYTTSGPRYEGICSTTITDYYYYFKTPSGRLIYDYDNNAYEFDGTQFTQLQTVTVHPQSNTFVIITDGLFAKDNSGNLIKWNDTTSNWEVLIPLIQASETLWAADANTLRLGPVYKLDNTGGTYSWVEDPLGNYPFIGDTYFIGQNVYMMRNGSNDVYQYDESTKTFTFIGNTTNWPNGGHWLVFENELYYFGDDGNVHKIDPSQVGTDQWDVETNILYTYWVCLYVEYNNKLYLTNSNVTNSFGYCYDVTETAAAVPSTNGTYVLKAVRSGDQVTFSWVLES